MNGRGASRLGADLAGDYAGTSRSLPSPRGAARPVSGAGRRCRPVACSRRRARWAGRSAGGRARPIASPRRGLTLFLVGIIPVHYFPATERCLIKKNRTESFFTVTFISNIISLETRKIPNWISLEIMQEETESNQLPVGPVPHSCARHLLFRSRSTTSSVSFQEKKMEKKNSVCLFLAHSPH